MPSFEDEYLDVLQNIEFAIAKIAHSHPDLTDYEVEKALNALMRVYKRPDQDGEARLQAGSLAEEVYQAIKAMCDWRLGSELQTPEGLPANLPQVDPLSLDEIQACLKRIRKSLQTWNKRGGRRGYLEFIDQFVG